MLLTEYVEKYTDRGECKCGMCIDANPTRPDPDGHVADMVFFKVVKIGEPDAEEFKRLYLAHVGEFNQIVWSDGKEHGYMEIGGWIGDQGLALRFMALGALLGVFELLTPYTVLGLDPADERQRTIAMQAAGSGFVTIKVRGD